MKIIIADTLIEDWGMDGSDVLGELEPYAKDCIILVTGYGPNIDIPDEFATFTVKRDRKVLGQDPWGKDSSCYRTFQEHQKEFMGLLQNDRNVLVVVDHNGQSMDAYLYLQDYKPDTLNLHVFAIRPFSFEGKRRNQQYKTLLGECNNIKSLCYFDSNELLKYVPKDTTLETAFGYWRKTFLFCINNLYTEVKRVSQNDDSYYYHWDKGCFLNADSSITLVAQAICWNEDAVAHAAKQEKQKYEIRKEIAERRKENDEYILGGPPGYLLRKIDYPGAEKVTVPGGAFTTSKKDASADAKSEVEEPVPKVNGKQICEELRSMRKLLADANGIPYETETCMYRGACSGTCRKCDEEARYLQQKLDEIPEEKRVYPQVEIERGRTL